MKDQRLHSHGSLSLIQSFAMNSLIKSHTIIAIITLSVVAFGLSAVPVLADNAPHVEPVEVSSASSEIYVVLELMTDNVTVEESVQLQALGVWSNGCTPKYSTHSIADFKVRVFAIAEDAGPCPQSLQEWSFPIALELTQAGTYQIYIYAISEGLPGFQLQTSMPVVVSDLVQDSQFTGSINYLPEEPQVNDDVIITVDGSNSDACVPEYVSHVVDKFTITIKAAKPVDMVCGQVITPWSFDVHIGKLAAGVYKIDTYVTSPIGNETREDHYTSTTMTVGRTSPGPLEISVYLPNILFK